MIWQIFPRYLVLTLLMMFLLYDSLVFFFYPLLNFQHHIKTISSKLSKALYILRSSKNLLSTKTRKAVYYALFHCNLIYCIPIWSCAAQKLIANLQILQQKKQLELLKIQNIMPTQNLSLKNLIFYL